jgi:hypothetical protein
MPHFNLYVKDELWEEFKLKTNSSMNRNEWLVFLIEKYCKGEMK